MPDPKHEVRTILIIDDDRDDYELVQEAVQEIDPRIRVEYMSDSAETVPDEWLKYDLVLLDINMPRNDGFYWLRKIRSRNDDHLPVVMYTNSLSPLHIAKAYDEGASLYFSKPDSFVHLRDGLAKLIHMDWSDPSSIAAKKGLEERGNLFQFE